MGVCTMVRKNMKASILDRLTVAVVAAVILIGFAAGRIQAADTSPPVEKGKEGNLKIPSYSPPCKLYIPSNYNAKTRWPVIYFLHGAGARPDARLFRYFTGGQNFIVVGLSYAAIPGKGRRGVTADARSCKNMLQYFKDIMLTLKKHYSVNDKMVFLTGLSMGGWGVNYYGFQPKARGLFRGYCIIAAGPLTRRPVNLNVAKGRPVLVLNGARDPNLRSANAGCPALKKAGADVTKVVIPNEGHVPGADSMQKPVFEWLKGIVEKDIQAARKAAEEKKEKEVTSNAEQEKKEPIATNKKKTQKEEVSPEEKKCRKLLLLAKNLMLNGKNEKAGKYLETILTEHKDTPWAEQARELQGQISR